MKTWTAHLHEIRPPVLLKEGFCWSALLLGPLWLLSRRAWIPAALAIATYAVVCLLASAEMLGALLLLGNWCLGLWGNDLLRWSLTMRGYTEAHVVAARDADSAFMRLLSARPDMAELFAPDVLARGITPGRSLVSWRRAA